MTRACHSPGLCGGGHIGFRPHRVSWGEMRQIGQSESDDIFVAGVKAKEYCTVASLLLFLFQWRHKNDLIIGSPIFSMQIKLSSDPLCPTCICHLI